jgi:diguanylate cyclase (GGDEF)-like protein
MGTVYEAVDLSVSSLRAIKETRLGKTNDVLRRAFEREAKLLANLRHPSLPKVMHQFNENKNQYLVMEFIPGNDLEELLERRDQPFSVSEISKWADRLLEVLEYLHTQSTPIVHRDIKPANLKVTENGDVMLLDFGLAKGVAGYMTAESDSSVYGFTPGYAPIEQMQGLGTDARSDLYALSVTLLHLLKGRQPPSARERQSEVDRGRADPIEPFLATAPSGGRVEKVLEQALALDRNLRVNSAAEMREALRRALGEDTEDLISKQQRIMDSLQEAKDHFRHAAFHDSLTDLPNKALFVEMLKFIIERARQHKDYRFGVMLFAIHDFQGVNEKYGDHVGDSALMAIARRVESCIREIDMAARLEGVKFAVLLDGIKGLQETVLMAKRIVAALEKPVDVQGNIISISTSIGITWSDLGYTSAETVLSDAETARRFAQGMGTFQCKVIEKSG